MFKRTFVALLALGGVSGAAQAAISVTATIDGQLLPICSNASNMRFTTAGTVAEMRFSYLCPSDGLTRTCTPTVDAAGDLSELPGGPSFRYRPFAASGGPSVRVICTGGTVSGFEIAGFKDGLPITGCNPAAVLDPQATEVALAQLTPSITGGQLAFNCPAGAGVSMPGQQHCYPVEPLRYDFVERRVNVECETAAPMLHDGFDFD